MNEVKAVVDLIENVDVDVNEVKVMVDPIENEV